MPEHASRDDFAAALFDQQSEEHRIADWGGDELFTRMPRPRRVDDAPAPRFRPSLMVLDQPEERRRTSPAPSGRARTTAAAPAARRSRPRTSAPSASASRSSTRTSPASPGAR